MHNKKIIILVCRGNIARSVIAEHIVKREMARKGLNRSFIVISRGIQGSVIDPEPVKYPNISYYPELYESAESFLKDANIDIASHVSTVISDRDARWASAIFAMDQKTLAGLKALFPTFMYKIHSLATDSGRTIEIPDPALIPPGIRQASTFVHIQQSIVEGLPNLLAEVASLGGVT